MANEELAFLTPGIEVSAKYRGAFCEAKVKKVDKNVKCKVTLKDDGKVLIVQDEDIRGSLRVGAAVEVRRPDTGLYVEGTVNRINDLSIYTVVFDDGDENTLRRTKLCLKGDRHFMKSETLDDLPLTHPEHFGTPVVRKTPKSKTAAATCSESESDVESSDDDSETGSKRTYSIHSQQNLVGRVLCVDFEERSRRAASTVPVLVVLPSADDVQLPSRHHLLVKSFKDGKFFTTTISNTKEFSSESTMKNKDKTLKTAFDKAQSYKERRELPPNWSKMELLGYSSSESGESDDDDEPDEKKDRFVAELFKFMDDRGTPINKAPNLGGFDLNLFKLFRIVQSMGGYNRVTNQMKWHIVHSKLNLPSSASVVSTNIKQAYKKYLHAFEDFNRKLGCTMVMSSQSRMSSRSLVSFRERDRDQTLKHSRSKRAGSTKDEDIDKVIMHKKDMEPEKTDKQMTALAPIKTGSDVASLGISAALLVKTRTSKKSGAKKDSGDSDSVSSDIIITPKTSVLNASICPSGKLLTEVAVKSSGGPQRLTKEDEKHVPTSSKTTKEEPARVTRGDLLKTTRESAVKEDRASVRKVDGRDVGRTKGEVEKNVEEKEEKQRGSRRMLRRATAIPSTEEEGEDETNSVNSEKAVWDEPSETVDSFVDEPKADDEIPRALPGRRQTICDDMHPIGTRMQVRYGKGKGQKIYEAKVLDTAVQSGVAKYFVHYNGWNSRYDEWIHKDVIVNVLEDPCLEMPKLRSSTAPSAKIMPISVRRRTNLSSGSPLPPNKDDARFGKSKVTHFGLEHTPSASRRTRSNSIDQVKPLSGRSRISKASETELNIGNNGTSSSSNSSSSLSSSSEEPLATEPKTEQNTDEDLSNSYHSCSPAGTPEMPDIYMSEDDEFGRDAVPKLQDHDAPDTLTDAMCSLPIIKLDMDPEQLNNVSFELDNATLEQETSQPLRNELPLSDSFSVKNDKMPVIEIQCKVEETALHSDDGSVKQLNEVTLNNSILDGRDEQKENLVTETAEDASTAEAGNNMAALGLSEADNTMLNTAEESSSGIRDLPSLTESSVIKTRRKKRAQERALEASSDDVGHDIKNDIKSADGKNVPGLPTEGEKKAYVRKRKQSCSFEFNEGTSDEQIKKNAYSDTESKMEDETAEETDDCNFSSVKRASALTREPTVGKDKVSKKAVKMSKTGGNLDDRGSEKVFSDSLESEISWKCDTELDLKLGGDCNETAVDQCSSKQSRKLESSQVAEEYETAHEAVDDRLQPSTCPLQDNAEDVHARDEDVDLSDFAVKCNEEMEMKNVFNDSPPASAENSPLAPDEASSPSHEELTSTKSEQEANLEVEKFMERRMESSLCCDSQSGYDFSTASSDSTTSSGSITRGFDNELPTTAMCRKKKVEEESSGIHPWKRRRERHKDECPERDLPSKANYRSESNDSDHDNSLSKSGRSTISLSSPAKSSSLHCESTPSSCHRQQQQHHLHRQSKYNFIDLGEGKYLEGEDRIIFLTNKIQDLRAAYMELKAEVASIDRRRRRHRVKEKELAQLSTIGSSSSSTMTST